MAYYGERETGAGPGCGLLLVLAVVVIAGLMVARVVAGGVGLDGPSVEAALNGVLAPPQFSRSLGGPSRDRPLRVEQPASTAEFGVAGSPHGRQH